MCPDYCSTNKQSPQLLYCVRTQRDVRLAPRENTTEIQNSCQFLSDCAFSWIKCVQLQISNTNMCICAKLLQNSSNHQQQILSHSGYSKRYISTPRVDPKGPRSRTLPNSKCPTGAFTLDRPNQVISTKPFTGNRYNQTLHQKQIKPGNINQTLYQKQVQVCSFVHPRPNSTSSKTHAYIFYEDEDFKVNNHLKLGP